MNWTLYSRERRWSFAAQFSLLGRLVSLLDTCKRHIVDLNASFTCCFAQQSTSALQAQLLWILLIRFLLLWSLSVRIWAFADVSVILFRFHLLLPRLFVWLVPRFFLGLLLFSFRSGFGFFFLRVSKCKNKFSYNVSLAICRGTIKKNQARVEHILLSSRVVSSLLLKQIWAKFMMWY